MEITVHNNINLEKKLTRDGIRKIQIIVGALLLGVLLFFGVVLFLYFNNTNIPPVQPISSAASMLLPIAILLGIGTTAASFYVPSLLLKKGSNFKFSDPLQIATTFYIVKIALLEGGSLFGIIVLQLSVLEKIIYFDGTYWLAAMPMLLMIVTVIMTFPTKEKIIELLEKLNLSSLN